MSTPVESASRGRFGLRDASLLRCTTQPKLRLSKRPVLIEGNISYLVDSIHANLPIPPIYVFKMGNENYILDGQQRILSIYFYLKGKFPSKSKGSSYRFKNLLSLTKKERKNFFKKCPSLKLNLENKSLSKSFEELDDPSKKNIHDYGIDFIYIQCNSITEEDSTALIEIFRRFNTGGEKLKEHEMRRGVFYSKFLIEIENLALDLCSKLGLENKRKENIVESLLVSSALLEQGYKVNQKSTSRTKFIDLFCKYVTRYKKEGIEQKKIEQLKSSYEKFFCSIRKVENPSSALFFIDKNKTKQIFNTKLIEGIFYGVNKFFLGLEISIYVLDKENINEIKEEINKLKTKSGCQSIYERSELILNYLKQIDANSDLNADDQYKQKTTNSNKKKSIKKETIETMKKTTELYETNE